MSQHPEYSGIYCQCWTCRQLRDREGIQVEDSVKRGLEAFVERSRESDVDFVERMIDQGLDERAQREKCADGDHEVECGGYNLKYHEEAHLRHNLHVWICRHCRSVYVPK